MTTTLQQPTASGTTKDRSRFLLLTTLIGFIFAFRICLTVLWFQDEPEQATILSVALSLTLLTAAALSTIGSTPSIPASCFRTPTIRWCHRLSRPRAPQPALDPRAAGGCSRLLVRMGRRRRHHLVRPARRRPGNLGSRHHEGLRLVAPASSPSSPGTFPQPPICAWAMKTSFIPMHSAFSSPSQPCLPATSRAKTPSGYGPRSSSAPLFCEPSARAPSSPSSPPSASPSSGTQPSPAK